MQTGLIYSTVLLHCNRKLVFVCHKVQLCWASPLLGRGNPAEQTPPAPRFHSQTEKNPTFFYHFAKPKYVTQGFRRGTKATFRQLSNVAVHDRDVLNGPYTADFRTSSFGNVPLNPADTERAPSVSVSEI